MIDSIVLLLIILIPALSAIFLLLNNNLSYHDKRSINIFSSLMVLILTIYAIFLFCTTLQDSLSDSSLYKDFAILGFINSFIVIGNDNFMIMASLAIISFCLSLFPSRYNDSKILTFSLLFKSSLFFLVLSKSLWIVIAFAIVCSFLYCLIFRKKLKIINFIPLVIAIILFIVSIFIGNSSEKISSILIFFSAFAMSGIPFCDSWLSETYPSSGDEIFAITTLGKLGIILFLKVFSIISINFIHFQIFFVLLASILFILRTVDSFKQRGLFRIFTNYSAVISYIMIINYMSGSKATNILTSMLLFSSLIIISSLFFCAASIANKTGTYSSCNIRKVSSMSLLLCFSCISAFFIPGTVGFVPYIMIIASSFRNSLVILALLLLSVPFIYEACFFRVISPMIYERLEDTSKFPSFDKDELIGLVILCFISLSIGIFPALLISPSNIFNFFAL